MYWRDGVLECWSVVLVCWRDGVLACWSVGVLECWSVGVLACWNVGVLVCCSVGVSECWRVGVLVCWNVRILAAGTVTYCQQITTPTRKNIQSRVYLLFFSHHNEQQYCKERSVLNTEISHYKCLFSHVQNI